MDLIMANEQNSEMIKPINLVLFFCGARTGHFGQGTFINQLLPFFREQPNIKMTMIQTDSQSIEEVEISTEGNMDVIKIPSPLNKISLTTKNHTLQKTYAARVIDICYPYLCNKPNLLFWVNSIDYLNISYVVKDRFSGCKLMYVHHSWSWKYFINIADEKFAEEWSSKNEAFHPKAFEWNGYQQQIAMLADLIITVTHHANYFFTEILEVPRNKVVTIYNGIAIPEAKENRNTALRKKYGIGENEKVILYSGRMTEEKGLPYLLKAFKLIADKHNNVRLAVIGNGEIAKFIPLAAPHWGKVLYTGELQQAQVLEFYELADIGVQPSLLEQCSFTAIEMRFHHLPLVVSGDIGLDEMFEDGVDALKLTVHYDDKKGGVKYLDHEEMADKIEQLLVDPDQAEQLAANGYKKALQLFDVQTMQSSYLQAMERIMQFSDVDVSERNIPVNLNANQI